MHHGAATGTVDANKEDMWYVSAQCEITEPCLCGGLDNDSVACHECGCNLAYSQVDGICKWCTAAC